MKIQPSAHFCFYESSMHICISTNTISSVQSLSHVRLFVTPRTAAHQASLSITPGVYPNPCPLSWWCHPSISSSVIPFSSCPQSFPAPGSFLMSQLFTSGGQSVGVSDSTSILLMNTQDWSPLGWTGWISLQSKGLLRVFSNTAFQNKHHGRGLNSGLSHKGSSTFWPRNDRCLSCLQPIDQN